MDKIFRANKTSDVCVLIHIRIKGEVGTMNFV